MRRKRTLYRALRRRSQRPEETASGTLPAPTNIHDGTYPGMRGCVTNACLLSRPRHSCARRLTRTSAYSWTPDPWEAEWRALRSTGRWSRPRVTRPPLPCVFTTTLLTSGPSRASSSTCTLPGFTSSTLSSPGTTSTTATGSKTTRAALRGSMASRSSGSLPQRSGALAGSEKPGARKPRLLHRLAQQSRTPLRTRPRCPCGGCQQGDA